MKKIHLNNRLNFLKALAILSEDKDSERAAQEKMAFQLGKRVDEVEIDDSEEKSSKKKKQKEEPAEEPEEESSEEPAEEPIEEPKQSPQKKDGKLPGAERLEDSELAQGQKPTTKDIIQRVNFLRAGASLKDKQVKNDIQRWIAQLSQPERLAVFTTLDAIAKIALTRHSAAEAPTFSEENIEIKAPEEHSGEVQYQSNGQKKPIKKAGPVLDTPITVGEGVVRKLKEVDVPVRSGKVVPFGSKSHISDLEERIKDLKRIRSYQERGSDSYHSLGVAITALKKQLANASKINGGGNPRTQPVAAIVEKEK